MTLLVDYENVTRYGLVGIDSLTPKDTLVIYYGDSSKHIRRDIYQMIEETGVIFRTVRARKTGKNYLDMFIAASAGEIYKNGERYIGIISKDKGFEAVKDYFRMSGAHDLRIVRAEDIEKALVALVQPGDNERRSKISYRSELLNLDKISAEKERKDKIRTTVKEILMNTPYWFRIPEISDFLVKEKDNDNRRARYLETLKRFGRTEGLEIYRLIKDAV